jgi:hypothetical protein
MLALHWRRPLTKQLGFLRLGNHRDLRWTHGRGLHDGCGDHRGRRWRGRSLGDDEWLRALGERSGTFVPAVPRVAGRFVLEALRIGSRSGQCHEEDERLLHGDCFTSSPGEHGYRGPWVQPWAAADSQQARPRLLALPSEHSFRLWRWRQECLPEGRRQLQRQG